MKILIDVGHPAHIHYFKNLANNFIAKGHEVLFTTREKDVCIELLKYYGFDYFNFGLSGKGIWRKIIVQFKFTYKLLQVSLKFKPDLFLNSTQYSAFVSWLLRKPHLSLEDTFNMEQVRLYLPFTSVVLTGKYEHPKLGEKEVKYNGYQELLYLHPKYFFPDNSILEMLGLHKNEKYVIFRFVAWHASHDYGHKGISFDNKIRAIKEFEKYAKVFISSEKELPEELKEYQIKIPPHKMHDALAFASLLWAESFTMPAECSILGVPSIINHNTRSYYLEEQEQKYNLCFNYSESEEDQVKAIEKGIELLKSNDLKVEWLARRDKMLEDKIDVAAFLIWFVENWPKSFKIMKENPDYQYNFK